MRVRRHPPAEVRFWKYVEKSEGCWLWTASGYTTGYGVFTSPTDDVKRIAAHRYSWERHHGPIPDGLWVLHKCDVRRCVNPDHLFLGTAKDNTADAMQKGRHTGIVAAQPVSAALKRSRTHCRKGHEYTPDNLYVGKAGTRLCRVCHVARVDAYLARKRERAA